MKSFFLFLVVCISLFAKGQYYYKDIIGTMDMNTMAALYKTNMVQSVSAIGFDEQGSQSRDFYERQLVLHEGAVMKVETRNGPAEVSNIYYRYDENGRISTIIDTSNTLVSTTSYTYDDKDRVKLLRNVIADTSLGINEVEEHHWFYGNDNKPEKMLRIFNKDTLELRFKKDESGNVIEEQVFKKGRPGEITHYYYNDDNRLTDIVRYNTKAKRLLPDYMFEYSESGQVIQKITTLQNLNIGYIIWRYQFDDKGLKIREANFTKDKRMIGKIEYRYTFGS